MTLTDWVLILFILVLLAFAIYDDVIMAKRKGTTLLTIPCCAAAASTARFSSGWLQY